ncbi:MAG TPA: hypothetical protein VLZ74_05300 [Methylocella sp.]|nr:hypothetical protein [Methylocella sp.]
MNVFNGGAMITLTQCAAFAGLAENELLSGVTPSARHESLLSSYLTNLRRGRVAVRDMIIADLRTSLDLGASQRAADLLIVLRFFLSYYPDARRAHRGLVSTAY